MHARLSWSGSDWLLRDLGSRNGTFVNSRPVCSDGATLVAGDLISLGERELALTLSDAGPPSPYARDERSGEWLRSDGGVLLLGASSLERATVFRDGDGAWWLEAASEVRSVRDGDRVTVNRSNFVLALPTAIEPTADVDRPVATVRHVALLLRVSRDEERVEVVIQTRGTPCVLPPRSHFYTLLLMARARQRDEAARALPEESRGWLTVDELCAQLATDENKVNVDMHRIRRDFGRAGLSDGGAVIERRRGTGQLRLASSKIAIETTDA